MIKIMSLFAFTFLFSCHKPEKFDNPDIQYVLFLSVQDKQGNDLIEGIDEDPDVVSGHLTWKPIDNELYEFKVIFPNTCIEPPDGNIQKLKVSRLYGLYYLTFDVFGDIWKCPVADMLIFELKCPYIFKDDAVHKIVTYWNKIDFPHGDANILKCIHMQFDGVEVIPISYDKSEFPDFFYFTVATVEIELR